MSTARVRLPTEKQFSQAVVDAARRLGWLAYRVYDSRRSEPGYPDLTLVHPEHGILWAELKVRGKLTEDQITWLGRIQAAGGRATVWRPDDWPAIERTLKGEDFDEWDV